MDNGINNEELKKAPLYEFVISDHNIYRAIYALESYIEELYLLNTVANSDDEKKSGNTNSLLHNKSDLELYYLLQDKYNWAVIDEVIKVCKDRLKDIIIKPNEYFETSVFFSLKKYDDEKDKVKFRPLHTATLIDQICMVAMLQILMFEDSDGMEDSAVPRRFPSDLLKSIPDNFYGNRGSLKLDRIYERWAPNYQAYNRKIVESCDKYSRSHKYEYEVSLDIKEFFPSVSPFYLFVNICDILKERYRRNKKVSTNSRQSTEEDIYNLNFNILKRITVKLLFLKIKDSDTILDSELEYYNVGDNYLEEIKKSDTFFAKGIAQGLPQSYFFGNLCMTDVRRNIMSDDSFKGKDYFYVDDSVIYIRSSNPNSKDLIKNFNTNIAALNNKLKDLTSLEKMKDRWESVVKNDNNKTLTEDLKEFCENAVDFHLLLTDSYKIEFHKKGKSKIQTIDDADREIKSLGGLGRNASGTNSFLMDGDDRRISRDKMNALNEYAWEAINQLESEQEKEKNNENNEEDKNDDTDKYALQLKVFKRFRKIFLSRNLWMDTMDSGGVKKAQEEWFLKLLNPDELYVRNEISSPYKLPEGDKEADSQQISSIFKKFEKEQKISWFQLTDKESFRAEAVQLLKCSSLTHAKELKEKITQFEENFSGVGEISYSHLYFHKYLEGVIEERNLTGNRYESLHKGIQNNFPAAVNIDTAKAIDILRKYIPKEFPFIFSSDNEYEEKTEKNTEGNTEEKTEENTEGNTEENIDTSTLSYEEPNYINFVKKVSDEFKRRILNAYFSVLIGVNPSEEVPFVKTKGGSIDYAAFRILIWLRNPNFDFNDFWHFLSKMESHALPERMIVDNGLPEVVKIFVSQVVNPKKIDNLIVTHRIVKGLWQNGSKFLNSYTLHNEEHAVKLIKLSMDIVRRIDYFQLKRLDYYILFLACYLHDISMVIHPDLQRFCHMEEGNLEIMGKYLREMKNEVSKWDNLVAQKIISDDLVNFWKSFGGKMTEIFQGIYEFFESDIRSKHPKESALFIKNKRHDLFKYLEETIVEAVANAGEDHGKDIYNIYDIRSYAKEDVISSKYISILLRMADLMDVSNDRINYHLLNENVSHLSADSKFHWISHLITDEITLIPNYEIASQTIIDNSGKENIRYFIRETLRFYLILNMKSLEPLERHENHGCANWCPVEYNHESVPDRYKDFEGITLSFKDKSCQETSCPMVCRWMNNKHHWLFPELARLQKYLNTVNYEPFKTEIEVNILFKDFSDINLKPSLFDDVRRYLKNEHNE